MFITQPFINATNFRIYIVTSSKILRRPFFITILFILSFTRFLLTVSSSNNNNFKNYYIVDCVYPLAYSNFDYYNTITYS